jgi:molecular chaperone GrpE
MQDTENEELNNNNDMQEDQNSALIKEIEQLKTDKEELHNKLIRVIADTDNFKKRSEKQNEESVKYSISSITKDLLIVLDNLDRAENSIPKQAIEENKALENFVIGVRMTKKEFLNILLKHGVVEIKPKIGDVFDHNLHQAVIHVDSAEVESGKIVEVMQTGYKIFDRLLRASMVSVAK